MRRDLVESFALWQKFVFCILGNAAALKRISYFLRLVPSLPCRSRPDCTDFGSVSTLRLLTASHCIRSPPNCWNCPNCMALRLRIRSRSIGARSSRGIPPNKCLPHQRITEAPPQWREVMINVWLGVLLSEGLLNAPA